MGNVRAMLMFVMRLQMLFHSFMDRTNMLARLMARPITGCLQPRIVRLSANCECVRVRFIGFASGEFLSKLLSSPKRHRYETRHIESRAGRCDRADHPKQPSNRHNGG